MLQRVQSIYLLIVVVLTGLLFLLPLFHVDRLLTDVATPSFDYKLMENPVFIILEGVIAVIAFVSIFMYKVRRKQIMACNLNMILICVFIALMFYTADILGNINQKVHYQVGTYLPLIQLIFTFLAMRAIKKDEELVRSADRLR